MVVVPVMGVDANTVIELVAGDPQPLLYVIVADPVDVLLVMAPVELLTDSIDGALEDHVPDGALFESVIVDEVHIAVLPVMAPGAALTTNEGVLPEL